MAAHHKLNIAIVGYASDLIKPWDPSNCDQGLPGSEEAVVYASQELASRGHRVVIYMNPPTDSKWSLNTSNPRWTHVDTWNDSKNKDRYDMVLMWRRFDVETGKSRSRNVFFYSHDSPPTLPPNVRLPPFPMFKGIFILSQHHWNQFKLMWPRFDKIPYIISGNGVVPEHFTGILEKPNPFSVGYFSNYARGLIHLLRIWPDIRREFPTATLEIYYGREHWGTMSDADLNTLINIMKILEPMGVIERGKVGHLELAEAMKRISVWGYPCIELGETWCITAVKAQMAGCIPVTTRIAALNETIHPEAPSIPLIQSNQDLEKYRQLLLQTLRRIRDQPPDIIQQERQKYIDFSQQFKWSDCVDKWLKLYHQTL